MVCGIFCFSPVIVIVNGVLYFSLLFLVMVGLCGDCYILPSLTARDGVLVSIKLSDDAVL